MGHLLSLLDSKSTFRQILENYECSQQVISIQLTVKNWIMPQGKFYKFLQTVLIFSSTRNLLFINELRLSCCSR